MPKANGIECLKIDILTRALTLRVAHNTVFPYQKMLHTTFRKENDEDVPVVKENFRSSYKLTLIDGNGA